MHACLDCGRYYEGRGSRCLACQRAEWRRRNARRAGSIEMAVYASAAYRRARREVLAGAEFCAWCGGHVSVVGKLTAGHLRPIREDIAAATDPAGLAPQCRRCQELEKHRRQTR
jgi:hypothetical protein